MNYMYCTLLVALLFTTRIEAFGRHNIHEVVIKHIAKQAETSNAVQKTLTLPIDHFDNKRNGCPTGACTCRSK